MARVRAVTRFEVEPVAVIDNARDEFAHFIRLAIVDRDEAQLLLLPHFPHHERRSNRVSDEHRLYEPKFIDPVEGHQ